jgi:hypothetical protein
MVAAVFVRVPGIKLGRTETARLSCFAEENIAPEKQIRWLFCDANTEDKPKHPLVQCLTSVNAVASHAD